MLHSRSHKLDVDITQLEIFYKVCVDSPAKFHSGLDVHMWVVPWCHCYLVALGSQQESQVNWRVQVGLAVAVSLM